MTIVNQSYDPVNNFNVQRVIIHGTSRFADVSSSMVSLNIFESLDSLVTGKLTVLDQSGIADLLKISGNELISVEFNSKAGNADHRKYKKVFRANSVSRGYDNVSNNELLEFRFCNRIEVENNLIKQSKPFKNKTISEIVTSILNSFNNITEYEVESTLFTKPYITPMLRPLDTIRHLSKECSSKETKSCTFFFYEDRDSIKFKSLGHIKTKEAKYTITSQADGMNTYNAGNTDDIVAIKMATKNGYNLLDGTKNGRYGCRTISHSLINKKVTYHDLTNDKFFIDNPLMNSESQVQDDPVEEFDKPFNSVTYVPGDGFYQDSGNIPQGHIQSVQVMENNYITSKNIVCLIPGNTELTVGDIIKLNRVSLSDEVTSDIVAGKWIITHLKHELDDTTFYTHIELMTDSDIKGV